MVLNGQWIDPWLCSSCGHRQEWRTDEGWLNCCGSEKESERVLPLHYVVVKTALWFLSGGLPARAPWDVCHTVFIKRQRHARPPLVVGLICSIWITNIPRRRQISPRTTSQCCSFWFYLCSTVLVAPLENVMAHLTRWTVLELILAHGSMWRPLCLDKEDSDPGKRAYKIWESVCMDFSALLKRQTRRWDRSAVLIIVYMLSFVWCKYLNVKSTIGLLHFERF